MKKYQTEFKLKIIMSFLVENGGEELLVRKIVELGG